MARRRSPILAVVAGALVVALGPPAVATPSAPLSVPASDDPTAVEAPVQQVVVQVDAPADVEAVAADAGATPTGTAALDGARAATVEVTPEGLARLKADPRVGAVLTRGTTVGTALAKTVPHIGAPERWEAGYTGEGGVIVVIDTGVDADFGGTLVGSACFAASSSSSSVDGHCGSDGSEVRAFDELCFALDVCGSGDELDLEAGRPCRVGRAAPSRDCWHGTAVSAVAARREPTPGVAPGAGVYGIRVFDPTGRAADLVDVYAALEHVRALADSGGIDIAAVNLSVATAALFSGPCDGRTAFDGAIEVFARMVDDLAERRIPVVAASGNDGRLGHLAFPACLARAVAVGASDLDDELAPFSNAGPGLDLLAPGAERAGSSQVSLTVPTAPGIPDQWAGTSFAAPHAAGALALIDEEYPQATVEQRVWLLRAGGVPVTTEGTTRWRLGLGRPDEVLIAGALVPGDADVAGAPVAAMGDFDGDGRADVLAHAPGPAVDTVAYGRPDWRFDRREVSVAGTYRPLVGGFRGAPDGPDDILWYAPGSAGDSLWEGQADRTFRPSPLVIDGTFDPHVGDFDGDGWDDVLWYAPGTDRDAIWYGGAAGFESHPLTLNGVYRVGVGDFDGDGRDDVVFHGPGAATDSIWQATPARGRFTPVGLALGDGSYLPIVLDANGDGADDLLLYAAGPAPDPLWLGGPDGFTVVPLSVTGSYVPVVGDLDGDGRDDVVWYAPGPAGDTIWFGTESGRPVARPFGASGTYTPLVGDVDDAAGDDLVWFNPASTTTPVWWSHAP